jgi:hypothetical protein
MMSHAAVDSGSFHKHYLGLSNALSFHALWNQESLPTEFLLAFIVASLLFASDVSVALSFVALRLLHGLLFLPTRLALGLARIGRGRKEMRLVDGVQSLDWEGDEKWCGSDGV